MRARQCAPAFFLGAFYNVKENYEIIFDPSPYVVRERVYVPLFMNIKRGLSRVRVYALTREGRVLLNLLIYKGIGNLDFCNINAVNEL